MIFGNSGCINNDTKEERINKVEEGINFILSHFKGRQQIFPRKISTVFSSNRQFTVYNKEQILNACIKADFIDCRINAYPVLDNNSNDSYYSNIQSPNLIFIDLDLDKSLPYQKTITRLEKTKNRSIKTIKERLIGSKPTILWTGNGYHIYIVINTRPLELIKELSELSENPSEEFLRYAEMTFSLKKKDSSHNPSFKSSLLRIPYTFNSKNLNINDENDQISSEIKIIQEFDKDNIQSININLIRDFRLWLADIDLKRKKTSRFQNRSREVISKNETVKKYSWIERLLQTPLPCFRRYCLYHILVPYLVNIRKLNHEKCFDILKTWLEKCNMISRIPFDIESEIRTRLLAVKNYEPLSLYKLRTENVDLYDLLN